ncbi:hypothetical protein [Nocardia sp. CC227C]|uniref:hypothetical protein n=1 Tax=Nocardia sp. CC227C TaxID=3044562 RepID=UPI00278C4B8A|nr:hypothetical protein [Nocardia sp. CC227C]
MGTISGLGLGEIETISGLGLGEIQKISGLGLGLIWEAVTFLPSGMDKSGSTYNINTSYGTVTGWVADTTNYPGSTLSGNGLVVQGGKSPATVEASLRVSNGNASSVNCTLRLILNANTGSPLVTGSAVAVPGFSAANVTVSTSSATLADGDVLTVQAVAGFSGLSTTAHANSWLHIT